MHPCVPAVSTVRRGGTGAGVSVPACCRSLCGGCSTVPVCEQLPLSRSGAAPLPCRAGLGGPRPWPVPQRARGRRLRAAPPRPGPARPRPPALAPGQGHGRRGRPQPAGLGGPGPCVLGARRPGRGAGALAGERREGGGAASEPPAAAGMEEGLSCLAAACDPSALATFCTGKVPRCPAPGGLARSDPSALRSAFRIPAGEKGKPVSAGVDSALRGVRVAPRPRQQPARCSCPRAEGLAAVRHPYRGKINKKKIIISGPVWIAAIMMKLMLAGQKARSSGGPGGPGLGQGRVACKGPFAARVEGRLLRVQPFLWTCPFDALQRKRRRKPRWDSWGLRQAAVKARSAWGGQNCACCSFLCLGNLYLPFRTKGFFPFSLYFYQFHSKNETFQ